MFDKKVLNIYSIIVGLFFLVSGIGKMVDTAGFSNLIFQYGLGYLMILSPLIVIAEIMLGLLLVLLINPKLNSLISSVLLVFFTIAFAYAHFKNGINDCGCFGTIGNSAFPPIFSFIRNFILIIMSCILWIKYPKEHINDLRQWKKVIILTVLCISTFISGYTFKKPFIYNNNTGKHKYQNQDIRDTELSKYIGTSIDSTYLIFCFTYTCPHCLNSIENLRQYESTRTVDRVTTLATGAQDDKIFFQQNFHTDFNIIDLPVDEISELTDVFPTAFYIEHDTIKIIIQSVLPSPVTFIKYYLPKS
jgi:uncharacterized membrane protein YphA (DoxX/SURF4 family)